MLNYVLATYSVQRNYIEKLYRETLYMNGRKDVTLRGAK